MSPKFHSRFSFDDDVTDSYLLRKDVRNKTPILENTVIDNKSELSLIGVAF